MAQFINSQGQIKDFSNSNMPVGSYKDGRTLYADGSLGWTQWRPYTAPTQQSGGSGGSSGGSSSGGSSSSGNSSGGGQSFDQNAILDQQMNDIYSGGMNLLGSQEANVKSGYDADVSNLDSQIGNETKKANTQKEQLLGDTQDNQNRYNKTLQSALSQAIRAYNALNQQAQSRFGMGSSAGGAATELAQQEFYRQQGSVMDKQSEGNLEFEKERNRIGTYIAQKIDDLTQYKKEALTSLKKQLDSSLGEIMARKYDLETNRSRDKMALLQGAVDQARSIAQRDSEFRQNLGLAAVSKMQEVAGRAFTPKEITAVLSEFGITMPTISQSKPTNYITALSNRKNEDQLSGLYS